MNKKPNRTKSVPLTFYVTDADSQRIHRKAKACGVSLTKYLTDCAVGKEIIRIDALTEFTKALKAQGNNLNQLTTLANMGKITVVYGDRLAEGYGQVSEQLRQLLNAVNGAPARAQRSGSCGERRHPGMSELSADKAGSE